MTVGNESKLDAALDRATRLLNLFCAKLVEAEAVTNSDLEWYAQHAKAEEAPPTTKGQKLLVLMHVWAHSCVSAGHAAEEERNTTK